LIKFPKTNKSPSLYIRSPNIEVRLAFPFALTFESWADIASDIQELFRDQVRLRKKEETQSKKLQKIEEMVEETGEQFSQFVEDIRNDSNMMKQKYIQEVVMQQPSNAPSTVAASNPHTMPIPGPDSTALFPRGLLGTGSSQKL